MRSICRGNEWVNDDRTLQMLARISSALSTIISLIALWFGVYFLGGDEGIGVVLVPVMLVIAAGPAAIILSIVNPRYAVAIFSIEASIILLIYCINA